MTQQAEWLAIDGLDEACESLDQDPNTVTWRDLTQLLPPNDGLRHIWRTQNWELEVFPSGRGVSSSRRLKITLCGS